MQVSNWSPDGKGVGDFRLAVFAGQSTMATQWFHNSSSKGSVDRQESVQVTLHRCQRSCSYTSSVQGRNKNQEFGNAHLLHPLIPATDR